MEVLLRRRMCVTQVSSARALNDRQLYDIPSGEITAGNPVIRKGGGKVKKFFTGVITALLLAALMGTTVFAAGSPTGDDALKQKAEQLNKNVTGVSVKTSNNMQLTPAKNVPTTTQVSDAQKVASNINSTADVLAMTDLSVEKDADLSKGITVTLSVPGIRRGDNVYVLHQTSRGWEVLRPSSVTDGQVTVTLYSLSPIAVVRYNNGVSVPVTTNPSGSGSQTNNSTNSNNTTGDTQTNNNNNNQNNNQNNTQNNPVNVEQNVTVNYPDSDKDDYDDGYADGYEDGKSDSRSSGSSSSGGSTGTGNAPKSTKYVKSPKTGESLPVLPFTGMLALAGIGIVRRKIK